MMSNQLNLHWLGETALCGAGANTQHPEGSNLQQWLQETTLQYPCRIPMKHLATGKSCVY